VYTSTKRLKTEAFIRASYNEYRLKNETKHVA